MRYTVNANTFMQLPYTTGTVQNISNTDIEISNEQVIGTGIILKAGETFAFDNATIYACARPVLDGGTGIISVVPFNAGGRGGESPIYVPKGSIAFSALPTTLNSTMLGWTYNVSDAFTTDSRFVEGSGIDYPAGENVVVVEPSTGVFKYDCFGGAYILPIANTTTLGGVKSSNTEGNVTVNNDGTMTYNPLGYRQPSTTYAVGAIAYHSALPTGYYLECTTAGTSGSGDLTISSPAIGGTVTDGAVVWAVKSSLQDLKRLSTDLNVSLDLDDYTKEGVFSVRGANINTPSTYSSFWGNLLVLNTSLYGRTGTGDYLAQILMETAHGGMYYRQKSDTNNWNPWKQQEAVIAKSLGANGYIKYASGLIVQWGNSDMSTNLTDKEITMPISFSDVWSYQVVLTGSTSEPINSTTQKFWAWYRTYANKFIVRIDSLATYGYPFSWIAIGY